MMSIPHVHSLHHAVAWFSLGVLLVACPAIAELQQAAGILYRVGNTVCFYGRIWAIPDFYDFDWQPFGIRDKKFPYPKELLTRFGSTTRGDRYSIFFDGSREVGINQGNCNCITP